MIVIEDKQLVIFTPPKCGSTSAHKRWCRDDVGGVMVIGPQEDGSIDKHTMTFMHCYRSFRHVCLWRDPHKRAVSLWWHNQYWNDPLTFDQFIDVLLTRNYEFTRPIAEIVDTKRVNEWWGIDDIDRIAKANELPSLPKLNRRKLDAEWTVEQVKRMEPWAIPDLNLVNACSRLDQMSQ